MSAIKDLVEALEEIKAEWRYEEAIEAISKLEDNEPSLEIYEVDMNEWYNCIEEIIEEMDEFRKEVQWDFKNSETFWKYFFNKMREEMEDRILID
jgi:hypothetical protein